VTSQQIVSPVDVLHVRGGSESGTGTPRGESPSPAWYDDERLVVTVSWAGGPVDAGAIQRVDCLVIDDVTGVDAMELIQTVRGVDPDVPLVVVRGGDGQANDELLAFGGDDRTDIGRETVDDDEFVSLLLSLADDASGREDPPIETSERTDRTDPSGQRDRRESDRRYAEKIRALHNVAIDLVACETEDEAFQRAIDAAEELLGFHQSGIYVREGDQLAPAMVTEGPVVSKEKLSYRDLDYGAVGHVYRTGESLLLEDAQDHEVGEPITTDIRAGICAPLGEVGVFVVVSDRPGAFDQVDRTLVEILVAHLRTAVERIRFENRIRRERNRFAALFENLPDAAVIGELTEDGELRVLRVNSAFEETFGIGGDVVEGDVLSGHVAVPPGESRVDLAADGVDVEEVRRQAANGVREFLFRGIAVDAEDSSRYYGIFTDITQRKERKRELERKTERLEEFAAIVSHDLRNPLSVARGWLEMLEAEVEWDGDGAPDRKAIAEMKSAFERMETLIDDLLTLSREGRKVEERTAVDAERVVERAWKSVETDDATLCNGWTETIHADETRLVQVFENLFRNAVEHGPGAADERGSDTDDPVRVEVGPLADVPGVYVADDGRGIDPEVRDSVFEMGVTGGEGTGLGVAIVDRIVEAHGWSLSVAETADGGARFEIRFGEEDWD